MTDQTQDIESRINSYLDVIESSVTVAGDFVVEQTPLVVQEYLAWYYWELVFFAVVFGSLFLILLLLSYKTARMRTETSTPLTDEISLFLSMVSGISSVPMIICSLYNVLSIIKVTIAPRVVLLEKISDLMP